MTRSITKGTIQTVCLSVIIVVLVSQGGMAATSNHGDSLSVAAGGQSQVSIVLGGGASDADHFAASELAKYFQKLSGATINTITEAQISSRPVREGLILLGDPTANRTVHQVERPMGLDFHDLKRQATIASPHSMEFTNWFTASVSRID
jgi:hypothetical protein